MAWIGPLALASGLFAQLLKVFVGFWRERRWQWSLLVSSGGMPSSHTATVTTLSLLVAYREGYDSALFSVVLVFSLYVVFEATGLRQEVGKQASLLNELMDDLIATRRFDRQRLRELVGHTWAEVGGGFLCGVFAFCLAAGFLR